MIIFFITAIFAITMFLSHAIAKWFTHLLVLVVMPTLTIVTMNFYIVRTHVRVNYPKH